MRRLYGSDLRQREGSVLNPAMNNTKWDEVRLAMYALNPAPAWSILATNGYQSPPDREWFYHFRDGGYDVILHLDIVTEGIGQREIVRSALRKIHVPGEETARGFRVFSFLVDNQAADFL